MERTLAIYQMTSDAPSEGTRTADEPLSDDVATQRAKRKVDKLPPALFLVVMVTATGSSGRAVPAAGSFPGLPRRCYTIDMFGRTWLLKRTRRGTTPGTPSNASMRISRLPKRTVAPSHSPLST